jgi:hypothetical protein
VPLLIFLELVFIHGVASYKSEFLSFGNATKKRIPFKFSSLAVIDCVQACHVLFGDY